MFFAQICLAQNENHWVLKSCKDGVSVYTRDVPHSNLKEMKMSGTVKSSLAGFIAALTGPELDDPSFAVTELNIYHDGVPYMRSTIDFPFPIKNRDLITYGIRTQDPKTGVVTIKTTSVADAYPEQDGYVRMPLLNAKWVLTPLGNGELQADYFFRSDPGGSIPDWVTNLMMTIGPPQTFKEIKGLAEKPAYQEKTIEGVTEK